jgi:hypothetical protein
VRGSLGSEVFLRVDILSEDNFGTIDLLRAPERTWSARRYQLVAYVEAGRGGIRGMDRVVTTCCLTLNRGEQGK